MTTIHLGDCSTGCAECVATCECDQCGESDQLVNEAREWLLDLYWTDDDAEEQIAEASDTYILRQIRRHYDGGIQGFMRDIA